MWTEGPASLLSSLPRAQAVNLGARKDKHGTAHALIVPGRYAGLCVPVRHSALASSLWKTNPEKH